MNDHQLPVFIPSLLEDPRLVRELAERNAPYLPVQRYFQNAAEYRASSAAGKADASRPMFVAPNFRGDWAQPDGIVPGAELLLGHEGLRQAAAELFDAEPSLVEPRLVFANLTWQLPFDQGGGHTDVPAFRGIDRSTYPVWILNVMGQSRLFEAERVRIATAVAWYYAGRDGGFEYWPDGPDAPSLVHEGDIFNTAIMGDNDKMFHRVRPVGERSDGLITGMDLQTRLAFDAGAGPREAWSIRQGDEVRARFPWEKVRVSVSWKAVVYRDAAERRRVEEHTDDLSIDAVFARFHADLDARGVDAPRPADPLRSPELVDCLARVYLHEPTCHEQRRAS